MKKNIFFSKKINPIFLSLISVFILIILIYFGFFYININKSLFVVDNLTTQTYLIPKNKEGKKIKFLDKKSINNFIEFNSEDRTLNDIDNLNYTIQIFSDTNFNEVKNYLKNYINLNSQYFIIEDFYIFSIKTVIGIDYFLTYKNFLSKNDAIEFCKQSILIDECLVINPKNE